MTAKTAAIPKQKEGYLVKFRKDNYTPWAQIWSNQAPVFGLAMSALIFLMKQYGAGFYCIEVLYTNNQTQRCAFVEFKTE